MANKNKKTFSSFSVVQGMYITSIVFTFILMLIVLTLEETVIPFVPSGYLNSVKSTWRYTYGILFVLALILVFLWLFHFFYYHRKYYPLMRNLDFQNMEDALLTLNKVKSFDEYGNMGKSIREILSTYILFASRFKDRLIIEKQQIRILFQLISDKAVFLLEKNQGSPLLIRQANVIGMELLLTHNMSDLIGKPFSKIISASSERPFFQVLRDMENMALQADNLNPVYTPSKKISLSFNVQDKKSPTSPNFSCDLFYIPIIGMNDTIETTIDSPIHLQQKKHQIGEYILLVVDPDPEIPVDSIIAEANGNNTSLSLSKEEISAIEELILSSEELTLSSSESSDNPSPPKS